MVVPRSTATWPSSGCSSPVIIRNSVVLPAPLGPTRPTFSPFWRVADASIKRIWWPICLLMLSRRIMCVRVPGKSDARRALSHVARARKGPDKGRTKVEMCEGRVWDARLLLALLHVVVHEGLEVGRDRQ